jgi:hypothetical protein
MVVDSSHRSIVSDPLFEFFGRPHAGIPSEIMAANDFIKMGLIALVNVVVGIGSVMLD